MNELQTYSQFNAASHPANHHGDLCRGTEWGVSFVLLDSKHFFGERDSLT